MATTTEEERAVQLTRQASESAKAGNLSEAARFLREATSLAPEHPQVKGGWLELKQEEQRSPLVGICRNWVKSRNEADGEKALRIVKNETLSNHNAEEAFEILYEFKGEDDILDEVTGLLLMNPGAQGVLAKAVIERPTQTYYELFERGDDSIDGLLRVLLNRNVWPSDEAFVQGHRDCFMLSLAMMMEEALEYPERAMKGVANLLAAHAEHLKGIIDADSFDVILDSLDIRASSALRSHATLATVKLLELAPDTAQELITKFVISRVKASTADGLIVAFSAAAAIFPITVSAAAALFLTEGFISSLVPVVRSKKSQKLEQAALELLNAACIDKACREAISRHCTDWLEELVASTEKHRANLAAVILVKLDQERQAGPSPSSTNPQIVVPMKMDYDSLVDRFKSLAIAPEPLSKRDSIEGLAFASLRAPVRESLANDSRFLRSLIETMKTPNSPQILYGGLSILVNLTAYLPIQSEEEKRMADLKAYANTQKPSEPDPLQDEAHVTARCKRVLDAGIMPLLVTTSKKASPGVLTSTLRILLSLSSAKPHRGPLAQQGAIKLLLQIHDHITANASTFPTATASASVAAQALSRILISTNPAHIFSGTLSATSAVKPLTALLTPPSESPPSTWQLHAFEALLALTNLASLDTQTQNAIIRTAFDTVNDDLLLSQNTLVRRAAAELLCNLMASPHGLAKFADPEDAQAKRRLHILLAISDVDDVATRSAAGGALAMILSCDEGVEAVLRQEKGVELLLELCRDENDDVRYRGVVCVRSVIGAPGVGVEKLKSKGAVEVLKGVLKESRRPDVLALGVETLKILLGQT